MSAAHATADRARGTHRHAGSADSQPWYWRIANGLAVMVALWAWLLAFPALAGQASLAWDASSSPAVTGYYVYYGVASQTYGAPIDVGNQTATIVPNLTAGQTYYFAVTAYDAPRNQSPFSNEVSTTINVVPPPPPTFADVPAGYWAFAAIEAIAYNSITLGCATNPLRFCPDGDVGRDEMAVFLERATRGINYPFAPTGVLFADVPISHWAVGPIEQLYNDGITLGCASNPLRFCPDRVVTRAEMAIFLLRARFGPAFQPGSATGLVFADVPVTHWAAAWIEEFARRGYTTGCRMTPYDFCPEDVVTRAAMAVFLQRVFELPGPPP